MAGYRDAMPSGHTPFALMNRIGNPLVGALLRMPVAHHLASHQLALITVTGRKSGREYTFPVGYSQQGEVVRIGVAWPDRKLWWRNLTDGGARVRLRVRGTERTGHAEARGDVASSVVVQVRLDPTV
jgi:hypothetical protein